MPIKFTCPSCGKGLKVADEAAGKCGRCPYCKNPLTVPVSGELPEAGEKIELETADYADKKMEEEDLKLVKEEIPAEVRRCPGCGIIVDKSVRICSHCGTDLLTGQKFIKAKSLAQNAQRKKGNQMSFWRGLFRSIRGER